MRPEGAGVRGSPGSQASPPGTKEWPLSSRAHLHITRDVTCSAPCSGRRRRTLSGPGRARPREEAGTRTSPTENPGGGPTIILGSDVTDRWGDHGGLRCACDPRVCVRSALGARNAGRVQTLHLGEPGCRQTHRAHPCHPSVTHHPPRFPACGRSRTPTSVTHRPQPLPRPVSRAKARPVPGQLSRVRGPGYWTRVHDRLSDS